MRTILWIMTWMHWWAMWKIPDFSADYLNPIFVIGFLACAFFDVAHWLIKLEMVKKGNEYK